MFFINTMIKNIRDTKIWLFKPGPKPLPLGEENSEVILLLNLQLTSTMTMTLIFDINMLRRPCFFSFLTPYTNHVFPHQYAPYCTITRNWTRPLVNVLLVFFSLMLKTPNLFRASFQYLMMLLSSAFLCWTTFLTEVDSSSFMYCKSRAYYRLQPNNISFYFFEMLPFFTPTIVLN